MAVDGINNSSFSNIRAITPLLLRNPDYMCINTRGHIYSV